MRQPIKETQALLKASGDYLRDRRPKTERAFYQALATLEAAEQESSSFAFWGTMIKRHALVYGAVAIVAVLFGLFSLYRAVSPGFLAAPTPTLAAAASQASRSLLCPGGMDHVPQGVFLMGATDQDVDAKADEKPQRQVSLDAFCIDHTEVSNDQYAGFLKATNHPSPPGWNGSNYPANVNQNYKDLPVVNVSWFDARDYCNWQGKQLPTEAQWEKAARGPDGMIYPWGNTFDASKENYGGTTPRGLQPVQSYRGGQSRYGVLNMAGNAAEWTADWYLPDAYTRMPDLNPTGPTDSAVGKRVVRGGSFVSDVKSLRTTARVGTFDPVWTQGDIGFRCSRPADK